MHKLVPMASVKTQISPPPTPPLKDITRDTPSPDSPKREMERPARSSSPDNCPICLDEFDEHKDRAYSNNCYHIFCFECLLEWSNNKRECPLCKRPFKSIVHKFKDNGSHEVHQLPILAPPTDRVWDHAMSFEWMSRMRRQFIQHRHRHLERLRNSTARPSPLGVSNPTRPHTAASRRFFYRNELYCEGAATPGGGGRYRRTSPEFYRTNPAMLHRLMPWLNRELVAILPSVDNVDYVENHILSEIKRVNIRSESFRRSIRPFILQYTDHFIHEFHQFAMSPYDMAEFDRLARYPRRPSGSRSGARAAASVDIILHPTTNPPSSSASNHESTEVEISILPVRSTVSHSAASTHNSSPVDNAFERRRWHRQRLADEFSASRADSSGTTDLLSVPRRRSGFVLHTADDVLTSGVPVAPRRRSGLVLNSADGGIHPEISSSVRSSRRERLNNQQRMAANRLERSLRVAEDAGGSNRHLMADRQSSSFNIPARVEVMDPRLSTRSRSRPGTSLPQFHLPLPNFASSTVDRNDSAASSTSSSGVPRIVSRVRTFLDNIDDELSNDAAPNTRSLSMPTYEELIGEPAVESNIESDVNPLQSAPSSGPLFPFYRGSSPSGSSNSSLSVNSSAGRPVRSPSPSLSSHSSDVILVAEEKPYRARTPILLTSSDSETDTRKEVVTPAFLANSRHLSSSSDESQKNSQSPPKHRKRDFSQISKAPLPEKKVIPSEKLRLSSHSDDSDCMVTFEAARPKTSTKHEQHNKKSKKSHKKKEVKEKRRRRDSRQTYRGRLVPPPIKWKNDRFDPEASPPLPHRYFWTQAGTPAESSKQKKSRKRRSHSKESKHHKHVLAGMKHPASSSSIKPHDSPEGSAGQSIDYTRDGAGQSIDYTRDGAGQSIDYTRDGAGQSIDYPRDSVDWPKDGTKGVVGQSINETRDRSGQFMKNNADESSQFTGCSSGETRHSGSNRSPYSSTEQNVAQCVIDPCDTDTTSQSSISLSNFAEQASASCAIQSNSSRSSPLIDVTTVGRESSTNSSVAGDDNGSGEESSVSNEETDQTPSNDSWYLDYSRTNYVHPEGRMRKPITDIRKQIRYFAKNKIAQKYDSKKCKKHDKGHKN